MQVLVSCCNKAEGRDLAQANIFVYLVDVENGVKSPVDLSLSTTDQGVTGIARRGDRWVFLVQNNMQRAVRGVPIRIVETDGALRPIRTIGLEEVVDPHSLVEHDGLLYVVSTGNDRILAFDEAGRIRRRCLLGEGRADTVHVNSIAAGARGLVATAFGTSSGDLKSSAKCGYAFDLDVGERLFEGIYHPHSVTVFGGSTWLCESGRNRVLRDGEPLISADGYVRGLTVSGDRMVVGVSRRRENSRSHRPSGGYDYTPKKVGRCELQVHDLTDMHAVKTVVELGTVTDEIYDVVLFQ